MMESEVKRMREENMTSPKREGTGPARRPSSNREAVKNKAS
jgi:hypothetical protein